MIKDPPPPHTHTTQEVFEMGDRDRDGMIDFAEFVSYIINHEKKLKLAFKTLDYNSDGR